MNIQGNRLTCPILCGGLVLTLIGTSGCSEVKPFEPIETTNGTVGPTTGVGSSGTTGSSGITETMSTSGTTGGVGSTGAGDSTAGSGGETTGSGGTGTTGSEATTGTPASTGSSGGTGDRTTGDDVDASAANGADPDSGMPPVDSSVPMDSGEPPVSSTGTLPRVETTEGLRGPFTHVVKVKDTPPGGWLIYPEEIGKDGIKHPLFVFGPGGGTTPQTYEDSGMHWDHYGSYGFVIYVAPRSSFLSAAALDDGLTWLIAQNDEPSSPLYQHLDTDKVAVAGHSQGSVMAFNFMPDERVTTTIHISGGTFDGTGPSNLTGPTMFLCGPDQSADTAFDQCEGDFANTPVPTFYTNIQGSDHLTSGRLGWGAIVAWLLWHLADQEDQWKKEFLQPDGMFQTGQYQSQTKNW